MTGGSASSCSTGAPGTAAQLCLTWRSSYLRLHRATSCPAVAELVLLRQCVLDELERRNPAGFGRWLSTGARAASDPSRYVGRDT